MNANRIDAIVIGAGVAGLAAAQEIRAAGKSVLVLDKGRGPGGRLSTRREEIDGVTLRFDHGAQYLTARDPLFLHEVNRWAAAGVVGKWQGRIVDVKLGGETKPRQDGLDRWVGTPGMSAICRHLADGLDVQYSIRATRLERLPTGTGWRVIGQVEKGAAGTPQEYVAECGRVIVAVPDVQARDLVGGHVALPETSTLPCWAVMAVFEGLGDAGFDGAFVDNSKLGWLAREASKPGRDNVAGIEAWVLQGSPEWSREHVEDKAESVARELTGEFERVLNRPVRHKLAKAHRWRYAKTVQPAGSDFLASADRSLLVCGDWLLGGKIEAGWLSGRAAGQALSQ
jgi:predicted NAD/FAD-dependent oxidoreductase